MVDELLLRTMLQKKKRKKIKLKRLYTSRPEFTAINQKKLKKKKKGKGSKKKN